MLFEALAKVVANSDTDGELTGIEIAQIAMRVADQGLEAYADKKLTPEEIFALFTRAYEEYKKESND